MAGSRFFITVIGIEMGSTAQSLYSMGMYSNAKSWDYDIGSFGINSSNYPISADDYYGRKGNANEKMIQRILTLSFEVHYGDCNWMCPLTVNCNYYHNDVNSNESSSHNTWGDYIYYELA